MATHSSIIAWRIPWREECGGYSPWGRKESDMTVTNTHILLIQMKLAVSHHLSLLVSFSLVTFSLFVLHYVSCNFYSILRDHSIPSYYMKLSFTSLICTDVYSLNFHITVIVFFMLALAYLCLMLFLDCLRLLLFSCQVVSDSATSWTAACQSLLFSTIS